MPKVERARKPVWREAEPNKHGRRFRKPMVAVYLDGQHCAGAVLHPLKRGHVLVRGFGPNTVVGTLRDKGYELGPLRPVRSAPPWLAKRLPEGAQLVGYSEVRAFPMGGDFKE